MTLSRLAGACNFCFNLLSPFVSIVRILSFQATSFQILLYALFPPFPWSSLLLFPSYFMLHNPQVFWIWCLNRWHDHTTADGFELSYHWSSQQHPLYPEECQSTLYLPVSFYTSPWSNDAPLPRNLASSATVSSRVSQQCNKIGLPQHW